MKTLIKKTKKQHLLEHLKRVVVKKEVTNLVQSITSKCETCYKNNPDINKKVVLRIKVGDFPRDYWQVDSAELPRKKNTGMYWYQIDTFSKWSETYPCHTDAAREVVEVLLNHIIPKFEVPLKLVPK